MPGWVGRWVWWGLTLIIRLISVLNWTCTELELTFAKVCATVFLLFRLLFSSFPLWQNVTYLPQPFYFFRVWPSWKLICCKEYNHSSLWFSWNSQENIWEIFRQTDYFGHVLLFCYLSMCLSKQRIWSNGFDFKFKIKIGLWDNVIDYEFEYTPTKIKLSLNKNKTNFHLD